MYISIFILYFVYCIFHMMYHIFCVVNYILYIPDHLINIYHIYRAAGRVLQGTQTRICIILLSWNLAILFYFRLCLKYTFYRTLQHLT